MKTIFKSRVYQALFLSLVFVTCFAPRPAIAKPIASVQQIQGEVVLNKSGSAIDLWNPVTQSTDVETGDSIKTKTGSCDLVYTDQATLHLDANTSITVHEEADSQDIVLLLGNLRARVDKTKVVKPFQVVTPTAVGAIRGTDVDFGFNDQGQLTVDLKNDGPVQVFNDEAQLNLNLTNGKKIYLDYNRQAGSIKIQNDPSSNGDVEFELLGVKHTLKPGEIKEVNLETATGEPANPNTLTNDPPENPNDLQSSPSPSPSPLPVSPVSD